MSAEQQRRGWWHLPVLAIASGAVLLTASTMLLLRGVEPFATWYYNFAWYPVLLMADGTVAIVGGTGRRGEFLLLGHKKFLATVLAWSAVVWLFYELFNFRLQNWYYVNLPTSRLDRWTGTLVAFATVLPAVFVAEGVLNGLNVAKRVRWPRFTVTPKVIRGMRITGVIMLALVLAFPKLFFPFVWGATMLLVEPANYQRDKERSLLADLERGEPGRLLRLLLGGALIGFTWECLNIDARAKWIYTVPGIENWKIFEMPVPGFFGFPPFSVECFILWQALVLSGLAVPRYGATQPATTGRRMLAAFGAVLFSVGVLLGMERMTVDSFRPKLSDLPGVPASLLSAYGYDPFRLAKAKPGEVARIAGSEAQATQWIEEAKLATLRGIGTDHLLLLRQLGINSVAALARQDSRKLIPALENLSGRDFVDARVRVWIRGARHTIGSDQQYSVN